MIKLIAAVSKNGCIGKDNDLIFQDKEDMKHFRETTTGHIVIMGRKTWDSIPEAFRPFKGRENFVITKKTPIFDPALSGATILREVNGKLWKELAHKLDKEVYIVGGGEIYKQTIDFADELIISRFHEEAEGDTFFPTIDLDIWKIVELKGFTNFRIERYKRK